MAIESDPTVVYNVAYGKYAPFSGATFDRLGSGLKSSGFDGSSVLPFRTPDIVTRYQENFPEVVVVEGAWNPGDHDNIVLATLEGIYGHVQRARGDLSEPPILQDTILFPSRTTSGAIVSRLMELNPDAYFIAAHFEDLAQGRFPGRTHVHDQSDFHPHAMTLEQVIALAQQNEIQLWHDPKRPIEPVTVSYPSRPTVDRVSQGVAEIPKLAGILAGVDIPSNSEQEMNDLIAGKGILADTVRAARTAGVGVLRVEVIAPLKTYIPSLGLLPDGHPYFKDIVAAIKNLR